MFKVLDSGTFLRAVNPRKQQQIPHCAALAFRLISSEKKEID